MNNYVKVYIVLIPIFLIFSLFVSYFLIINVDEGVNLSTAKWTVKEKEIHSKLMRVPILLYHNIDGKGPFSVTSETLRDHFEFLKKNNIKVVSLSDLVEHLENPKPFEGPVVVITFDDGYKSMYTKLFPIAKEYGYPVTLFVYADFVRDGGSAALTYNELREMDENGIDIQSHTISHADLAALDLSKEEDRMQFFHEVYMSKRIIEQKLSKEIKYIAFPYGRYNSKVLLLSDYAGYEKVMSTEYGANILSRNNYTLHRHHIKRSYSIDKIKNIVYKY